MSNILIIKHGSLGDIAQISGAIQDIKENHTGDKVFILTTSPYEELFLKCPYIDEVYIDPRLPRLNIFYLIKFNGVSIPIDISIQVVVIHSLLSYLLLFIIDKSFVTHGITSK